jgi:hypothetical protein
MDHQIQKLRGFSLELKRLDSGGSGHGVHSWNVAALIRGVRRGRDTKMKDYFTEKMESRGGGFPKWGPRITRMDANLNRGAREAKAESPADFRESGDLVIG